MVKSNQSQGKGEGNGDGRRRLATLPAVTSGGKLVTGEALVLARWKSMRDIVPVREAPERLLFIAPDEGTREAAVAGMFDMLRTLLLDAMQRHNLRRIAVTSPRAGSGTSFVAANLALSLARRQSLRIVLADLDLRNPGLARSFGVEDPGSLISVLEGNGSAISHLRKFSSNLGLLLNGQRLESGRVLLPEPESIAALEEISEGFEPDVMICDLPPVLDSDDLLAFLPNVDGVLLVVDGTQTRADDLRRAEALLKERSKLIGVVLNRGEGGPLERPGLMQRLGQMLGFGKRD